MSFSSGWHLLSCIISHRSCFPNTSVQLQSTQLAWPEHVLLNTVSLDNSLIFNHCRVLHSHLAQCLRCAFLDWMKNNIWAWRELYKQGGDRGQFKGKIKSDVKRSSSHESPEILSRGLPGSVRCDYRTARADVLMSPGGVCVLTPFLHTSVPGMGDSFLRSSPLPEIVLQDDIPVSSYRKITHFSLL